MDSLASLWAAFIDVVMQVLPLSPFRQYIDYLAQFPYLGWINWFIPMNSIVSITATWLVAVSTHYTYLFILRWLKLAT